MQDYKWVFDVLIGLLPSIGVFIAGWKAFILFLEKKSEADAQLRNKELEYMSGISTKISVHDKRLDEISVEMSALGDKHESVYDAINSLMSELREMRSRQDKLFDTILLTVQKK